MDSEQNRILEALKLAPKGLTYAELIAPGVSASFTMQAIHTLYAERKITSVFQGVTRYRITGYGRRCV